ncbi:gp43 [Lomovskayavirus C31]|uniref:Probable tape measure protein n=1 Tax=Streptomyces phage phiC31 TaxID=10719 RepID=TMP_BPPHC|nr:tail length tape measure protein [Lomovskayavirus C31]Q9ZXA5.1 RecName: Full=Probable tape measure protein; Short=TMP; AltName: Full=Gene product 43; Short=gp43 [Lomovskayavirus C31]CAA07113.1 gp43 [Lomovskayavirus C31]
MARPIQITIMGDADQLSETLDQASEEVSAFGEQAKGLALAAGGAIAVGIGAGIAEALEREAGNDVLAAQLGATPAEAKRLGEAAGEVYSAGYGESVADANEALKGLWQQGLVPAGATADDNGEHFEKAMDVATVLGDEVGPTSNAVGQMLKTGMAKNADEAFDILVRGAQEGANKSEDLLDTFNEYGVQFKGIGLDGKTAMGLLSQGLQGGARDADLVADSLKEFGLIVRAGGDEVNAAYKSMGLNGAEMTKAIAQGGPVAKDALDKTLDGLRKIKDPAERIATAVTLFGTQAEDMQDALLKLDPSSAVETLGKVDGAAKSAGETMHDNAATKIKAFTRGLQTGLVDFIGGTVLPILEKFKPALEGIGSTMATVGGFVSEHSTTFKVVAGIITAVLLPALIQWGVQSTINAGKAVVAWVTSSATAVIESTKQALAHAKVVAGWIASGVQAGLNAAKVVAGWVLMGAQSMIQGARMAAAWLLAMGPIPLIIAAIVGLVVLIVANWDKIWAYTKKVFQWLWDWVKKIFNWLEDLFLNFTGPGLLIKHWDKSRSATKNTFNNVKNFAKDALNAVVNFVKGLPGRILSAASSLLSAGKRIGGYVIDGIKNGLSKLGGFASSLASAVGRAAKGAINGVIDLLNWATPNKLGWGKLSIDLPDNPIPKIRAMGGPASGWTRVGERGPEDVFLPNGSTVRPNHALSGSGGVTVNVQTNADPFAIGREVAWALRTSPA